MTPQYLYRYRPINEYSIWEIENNSIYLTSLKDLNDDKEGLYDVDYRDIWSVRRHLIVSALKDRKLMYAFLSLFLSKSNIIDAVKQQADEYLKEAKYFGVSCFTERHNNWHMWTKYADDHKGVVLEYDLSRDAIQKDGFRKVRYEDRPPISMADVFNQQKAGGYFDLLSFKDPSEWALEEEWRLLAPINPEKPNDPKRILLVPLSRVITGARASDEDKCRLQEVVDRLGGRVKFAEYEAPLGQESNGMLLTPPK